MKYSIAFAFNPCEQWIPLARAADAAGFHSVIISDHLIYPGRLESPYPYTATGEPRWQSDTAWPDPMVAIGAMAGATERLRFFTSIYILALRHPVQAAKEIATADVFSGGRLDLAVGAGWMREEFDLLGVPFAGRGRRLEECVEIVRKLWQGGMVEHRGEFYGFDPLQISPLPTGRIPIWGGGTSEPALQRAATRFDGWASEIQNREEIRTFAKRLHALRAESALADEPFGICAAVLDALIPDDHREMEALGVTQLITVPWLQYGIRDDDVDEKCDAIRRYADEFIR